MIKRVAFAIFALASLTIGLYAQGAGALNPQAPSKGAAGNLWTGAWGPKPLQPDARGWGWMTKSYVSPNTPRPFYNQAKEKLFQDKQVTGYTISAFDPQFYCEVRKHWDYIWFEMQHSTLSWDEIKRMMQACPGPDGAAPMIRMPDALEANIQKATDMGVLGIIVPTVDDALEARDAARFSRYPPFGRRSCCAAVANQLWPKVQGGYRQTINDNFLVAVMIETLEGINNADEIANTFGLDLVIQGNNDLSQFSGWNQNDERYQQLLTISHNATLRAGKYWGNAGQGYLTGNPLSPATRFVQNGPSHDGWKAPARTGGPSQEAELPFGVSGSDGPGGRRGGGAAPAK
jgi:2-keto-3-deoxy-L-rhamnonate aldolase RhmA